MCILVKKVYLAIFNHLTLVHHLGTVPTSGKVEKNETIQVAGNYGYIDFEIEGLSKTNVLNINETLTPEKVEFINTGWKGYTLPTEILPTDITWKSSNDAVFTVNESGVISAQGKGTAKLTATLGDCTKEYTIKVEKELQSISLPPNESLYVGNTITLEVTYNPEDIDPENKKPTWSSSNNNVAQVDSNGKVTAISAGTTEIKAVVDGKEATCLVTVAYDPALAIIKFDKEKAEMSLNESTELTIIKGADSNSNITWKVRSLTDISKEYEITDREITKYIQVEETENNKTVEITVNYCEDNNNKYQVIAYKDNQYYGVFNITVNVPLEQLQILGSTIGMRISSAYSDPDTDYKTTIDYTNENLRKFELKVGYIPSCATFEEKGNVKWTIENQNIIRQNEDGSFTILRGGMTYITAQVGEYKSKLRVTIINDNEHKLKGDVNYDGKVTLYDALQILKQAILKGNLSEDELYIMDYDDNGKVTLFDALKFLQKAIIG